MSPVELERYLHGHIPLSQAMQITVLAVSPESVTLSAPLAPNINHRATVFGGSASAVAILAAWSLLHVRLAAAGIASRSVIQRNSMSYERPISGRFTALATAPPTQVWEQFLRTFERRGKARITLAAELHFGAAVAGRLEGEFVAMAPIDAG
jgi:thioesterase domain-containing protein